MKILITGGSGMVGKNFLDHPLARHYEIIAPNSSEVNLLNFNDIFEYIGDLNPELIIHCAGVVGGIQSNILHPFKFISENAQMGINLILSAKQHNVKKLLNLGSSCMYPRDAKNPLVEDYLLKGELEPTNEGYALAKIMCLKLCELLNKENPSFKYKTLIPCNLYGRWDKFSPENSHMIPGVIRKIYEAKKNNANAIEIWGDGTARREFMYVEDLIDFMYFAINQFEKIPQYINVGLGQDYSIKEYYQEIKKIIGYQGDFYHNLNKPTGMKQKLMNSSKVQEMGWKPQYSLKQGLEKTFNFFLHEVIKND
ncbi:MAG: GDP-L-fucose synthase [Bdellovibrionaceae bacterium]|nr:GDP-L-fucose synthase [Pseudobdellovibrionaceae bacterium]